MVIDYSHHFNNKIKLFLTESSNYWDNSPASKKDRILEYTQYKKNKVFIPNQVHGDKIVILNQKTANVDCDAIIYNGNLDLIGAINVADCIPVCIYDPNNNYIALVHSGWKGTLKKIVSKTIRKMVGLGANKGSLGVFIGPSIRGCCYEVEHSFALKFYPSCIIQEDNHFYVDLTSQLLKDLYYESIIEKNIFIDSSCTFENVNLHSFRRDKQQAGRMSLVAYVE